MSEFTFPSLTFDRLQRMQSTLERRAAQLDAQNIRQVGFAPLRLDRDSVATLSSVPVTAQFDVQRKLQRVPETRFISPVESIRLLDRETRRYQTISLPTDVMPTGPIRPTGVRVERGADVATTSTIVRWTKATPAPSIGNTDQAEDPRWRWGVLTVAHLFGQQSPAANTVARVERQHHCGIGPESIRGQVLVRGRIPGGPDIGLIETGLDRLWLSGLLLRPDSAAMATVTESQLIEWISMGTHGSFHGEGTNCNWRWETFYPELTIAGIGRLRHVVRYRATSDSSEPQPFGPGSSGGVIVAGGIPIGLQVAAISPDFRVAFAQCFDISLQWLRGRLQAQELHVVHLLTDEG